MHAGSELIEIEKRLTRRDYLCKQKIVGGTFRARVEEQYFDIFGDTSENDAHPSWCPFLRRHPNEEGKYICTIHGSRPSVCRTYVCCTMRIFDGDDREVGKVKGRRSLSTEDAALRQCWDESIVPFKTDNDVVWRGEVVEVLDRAGYLVEIYE